MQCANGGVCDAGVSGNPAVAGKDGTSGSPGAGTSGAGAAGGIATGVSGSSGVAGSAPPPPPKKANGETCQADVDCLSVHCDEKICCEGGNCCRTLSDCPANTANGIQVACNDLSTCQGSAGKPVCQEFRCKAEGDENDTACTSSTIANACGSYKPVRCNGMMSQTAPVCATTCASDADCDDEAHCDATKHCVPDAANSGSCMGDTDCVSGHCSSNGVSSGFCCDKGGDCCAAPSDCPDMYASAPNCDDASKCIGSRMDKTCVNSQCSSKVTMDPTACTDKLMSDCGLYADSVCNGRIIAPTCRTSCMVDSECDTNAYCNRRGSNMAGECQMRLVDGASCNEPNQCVNKVCQNQHCCADTNASTLCCDKAADCPAKPLKCRDKTSCAGVETVADCGSNHTCRYVERAANVTCQQDIACPPGYRTTSAVCPQACFCAGPLDCADGFICDNPMNGRGACVRGTPAAGSGAAGAGGAGPGNPGPGNPGPGNPGPGGGN